MEAAQEGGEDMKVKTNLKAGGSRYVPPTGGH
jgi:hypothetical protein